MPPEAEGRPPRGEKRPANGEPVIRRTSNGRTQISHVREGGWTAAAEADFLALLRETGNFDWSARAVGFNPVTLYRRQEEWPAFARGCCEALEQAEVRLNYRLVAYAHALLRPPGGETGAEPDGGPPAMPFDPEAAMRILAFLDRRRDGGTTRGRRKGAPERSFDEVAASILGKIEAIERHEAMYGKRADGGDAPPAPDPGGGQDP